MGTIGHVNHGKAILTTAITKTLSLKGFADFSAFNQIGNTPEEKTRGITMFMAEVDALKKDEGDRTVGAGVITEILK